MILCLLSMQLGEFKPRECNVLYVYCNRVQTKGMSNQGNVMSTMFTAIEGVECPESKRVLPYVYCNWENLNHLISPRELLVLPLCL